MPQTFGPSGANKGFSAFGIHVSFSLNPLFATIAVQDDIAEVKVFVIADGVATLFDPDVPGFKNDISSFHKDESDNVGPQHTPTGLDPTLDPPKIWEPAQGGDGSDED